MLGSPGTSVPCRYRAQKGRVIQNHRPTEPEITNRKPNPDREASLLPVRISSAGYSNVMKNHQTEKNVLSKTLSSPPPSVRIGP